MVALLNLVMPLFLVVVGVFAYRSWKRGKTIGAISMQYVLPAVLAVYVYQVIQPSYLPKGDVPPMRRMPAPVQEFTVTDRLLKPKQTDEERTQTLEDQNTYTSKVQDILYNENQQ